MSVRLGLIGVGRHCRREHLPALAEYLRRHPDRLILEAVCDLDQAAAKAVARDMGFVAVYPGVDTLIAQARLDAVIAVTPVEATAAVACKVMEAGIPLLMEKPLGINLEEARAVVTTVERTGSPVMVGMNRRFDPVIREMGDWLNGRKPAWVSVRPHRKGRAETGFIKDVVPHPLDAMAALLGEVEVVEATRIAGATGEAFLAKLTFGGSIPGILECLPDTGRWLETYTVCGPGFHAEARSMEALDARADNEKPCSFTRPDGIVGQATFQETRAFLDGVHYCKPLNPHPAEVLKVMHAVDRISKQLFPGYP